MSEYTDRDYELMERFNLKPEDLDEMSDEEIDEIIEEAQDQINGGYEDDND